VRDALLTGLDNWWLIARLPDEATRNWLGLVLQASDRDSWRAQVRQAVIKGDRRSLEGLAENPETIHFSPAAVSSLAWALIELEAYDVVIALLKPKQLRYPSDIWLNVDLAYALVLREPNNYADPLPYYSIAATLRPDVRILVNLGHLLFKKQDWDGVIAV